MAIKQRFVQKENNQAVAGWSKGCTFIWAFQISYLQIQAYFLLPIISRVSLNSYKRTAINAKI